MNIFITLQESKWRDAFLPKRVLEELSKIGNVRMNEYGRAMTEEELAESLTNTDICFVLSWLLCPPFSQFILDRARDLRLIISPGASVAPFITDCVYERGIKVCSANSIMAEYVAEGTLAYMLAAIRQIPQRDYGIRNKVWNNSECYSLIGRTVGLIGFGAIGRKLVRFLEPFKAKIKLFDPYIQKQDIEQYHNIEIGTLQEVLHESDIISIHASRTEETYRMINKENLKQLKDGAILINTSRGALIDEAALIEELKTGRIFAALDVFEVEPLPEDSYLRQLDNVILMPHTAGMICLENYSWLMLDEIKRFITNEPLEYEIPFSQYKLMTS